jgi:hypothetical protein
MDGPADAWDALLLSRSSVDPPIPLAWEWWSWVLDATVIASLLSVAMALSLLRRWFMLVAGVIAAGALWGESRGWHWLETLNPLDLDPALVDGRIQVPVGAALAKAAIGLGALAVAWGGFLLLGTRIQDVRDRMGWWPRVAAGARRVAAPAVWIAVVVLLVKLGSSNSAPSGESKAGDVFWQDDTQHYEFLMRKNQWNAAKPLLYAADKVFDQVSGFFQGARSPDRILVDLDGPVSWDAAGQTGWTKVRIPLRMGMNFAWMKEILGHETAHVLMHRILSSIRNSRGRRRGKSFAACLHRTTGARMPAGVFPRRMGRSVCHAARQARRKSVICWAGRSNPRGNRSSRR